MVILPLLINLFDKTSFLIFNRYFIILPSEPEYKYPVDEKYRDCKKAICECDSQAAKCFGEAHYNKSHIVYDTSKCQSK